MPSSSTLRGSEKNNMGNEKEGFGFVRTVAKVEASSHNSSTRDRYCVRDITVRFHVEAAFLVAT
ncbi:hypothetical protein SESBI_36022 [Sesbania bispinosa]|nr:hypothetical protein SESBI_36022 [Sesbania bispinosa]